MPKPPRPPLTPRLIRWFDRSLGGARLARKTLDKVFPDHWSFLLGEVALYCFIVLVLTGTYLALFFSPSQATTTYSGSYGPLRGVEMSEAYNSAIRLSFDVRAGLVMRQIHHWAALLFVAAIVAHLARIFFTGAFRRPRELNWMIGVTLLLLAMVNGFAGYSLLDDQLSGTGLRVANAIILSIPVIGTWASSLAFGGPYPGPDMLQRLFVAHILLIPAVIGILIVVHLALVIRHRHTQFPGPGRRENNVVGQRFWPTYTAKAGGLFFLVAATLAALGGLAQINAIWVSGPYRPADVSSASQPDWYMGWADGGLRLMPPWEIRAFRYQIPNPFYPGVLLPTVVFAILYWWPFLERALDGGQRGTPPLGPPPGSTRSHRHRSGGLQLHRHHVAGRLERRHCHHLWHLGQRGHLGAAHRAARGAARRRGAGRAAVRRAAPPRPFRAVSRRSRPAGPGCCASFVTRRGDRAGERHTAFDPTSWVRWRREGRRPRGRWR